jgi:hypothetical protein
MPGLPDRQPGPSGRQRTLRVLPETPCKRDVRWMDLDCHYGAVKSWTRPYEDRMQLFTGTLATFGTLIFAFVALQMAAHWERVPVVAVLTVAGFAALWLTFAWRLHRTALVPTARGPGCAGCGERARLGGSRFAGSTPAPIGWSRSGFGCSSAMEPRFGRRFGDGAPPHIAFATAARFSHLSAMRIFSPISRIGKRVLLAEGRPGLSTENLPSRPRVKVDSL